MLSNVFLSALFKSYKHPLRIWDCSRFAVYLLSASQKGWSGEKGVGGNILCGTSDSYSAQDKEEVRKICSRL